MSRWRELIMDFGQIFGTEKSYATSEVFSVESDLDAKRNHDLQLRRTLEVHFRPLFQRFVYGGEKIACHDLKRLLHDPDYKSRLPADKILELDDVVDFNKGKAISYIEFVRIVLGQQVQDDVVSMASHSDQDSNPPDKHRLRHAVSLVCRNTEPQEMVDEKMEKYGCCWNVPFFMIAITLAQIVAFVMFAQDDDVTMDALKGVAPDNQLMYLPTRRRECWRFFSYCLVHQGYADLLFNVAIQLLIGVPLEIIFSWWRMALVYIMGVMLGSCSHSIADHYTGLAGAAGGSYAILGAHIYALIKNWKQLNITLQDSRKVRYLCCVPLRLLFILLLVVPQVFLAVYKRFFMDDIPLKIGFAHYISGLITGLCIGDAFFLDHRRKPWQGGVLLSIFFSLLIVVGLTIVINIAWQDYPAEDYS